MKLWTTILFVVVIVLGISFSPKIARGQDQDSNANPKPAAKALPPIGGTDDQDTDQTPDALQPDDRPLTGLQQLTTGAPPELHSYWIPGVTYTNFIQSNALGQGGGNGWNSTSYFVGSLSLLQNWSNSQLSLNYSGGGEISSDSTIGNGQYQQLGVVQTFQWRRWQLTLLDQFAYLPESEFGFGAGSGIQTPGVGGGLAPGLPGLQNGFTPSQSILTAAGPRYTNSFGTQVSYTISRRSSVTFGGVYGILRFTQPGNIESNNAILNAGYNYQVSKTDTLGLSYDFIAYHYLDFPQAMGVQAIQGVYGKRITGRLALQISGGPEIINFRESSGTGTQTRYIAGTGLAGLTYALAGGSLSANYSHGVTGGSGVFQGATTDQVTGSATRRLSRVWSGNFNLGYAHNTSVVGGTATQNQEYNTVYVGAGVQRPLSRTLDFRLSYTANIETSSNATCVGPNCGTSFTTHMISVGMSWRARPFVLH
jgi:hypothetical protein